jgi:hypothetical protein
MLNVFRPNPFNTRYFLLQIVGAFAQIQTLVHQLFKLQSSNGEPRLSSSGKSYPPQAHSVLPSTNLISNFSFALSCSWQALAAEILIPVEDPSVSYLLGPVGISDPSEFITAESQRIPFKASLSKPYEWQDAFKNWPLPPIAGWKKSISPPHLWGLNYITSQHMKRSISPPELCKTGQITPYNSF